MNLRTHHVLNEARAQLARLATDKGRRAAGIDLDQARRIRAIRDALAALVEDDPRPPECQVCAEPLGPPFNPPTSPDRRYCSNACRQAAYRERNAPA